MTETKNQMNGSPSCASVKRRDLLSVTHIEHGEGLDELKVLSRNGTTRVSITVWSNSEGGRLTLFDCDGARLVADLSWEEMDAISLSILGTRAAGK